MTDPQGNWKTDFYKNYSGNFKRIITKESYASYRPYGKHIIKKFIPENKNINILDLGCGIGGFLNVFQEQGYLNIEGVDISEEDVKAANSIGMVNVKQGEIFDKLKSSGECTYDVVLLMDVIEHFGQEDILIILKEAFRVMKSGGTLILHVPNSEGIFGSRIRYSDFTHENSFTVKSLSQICTYCGFELFECLEDAPIVHNSLSLIRRILWSVLTFPFRLLHVVETGTFNVKLSQNILFKAVKI